MRYRYWLPVAVVLLAFGAVLLMPDTQVEAKPKRYQVVPVKADWVTIRGTCALEKAVEIPVLGIHRKGRKDRTKEEWTIPTPRLKYDPKHLGLADCVVYLREVAAGKDWTPTDAFLLTANDVYVPHVQVVKPETQLKFMNATTLELNTHGYIRHGGRKHTVWNQMVPAGGSMPEVGAAYLEKPGRYLALDDCCPWYSAYVIVASNPYYSAATRTTGRYEITQVPPGTYELVCWHAGMLHEAGGAPGGQVQYYKYSPEVEIVKKVVVKAGKPLTVDFTVPAPR